MNLQYDNQSQNDSQPQVIDKLFHQKKEVHAKFFPTISNLHDLALRTQDEQIELGVSLYTTSEGAQNATYGIGNASSIFEPTPPLELKGKIRSGVFVHCHPIHESERAVGGGRSLHILPSGTRPFEGDFEANFLSRVVGGYLNVASKYGFTMYIGTEGISRQDSITRKMRVKLGAHKLAHQRTWKVLSGEKAGSAWVGSEFPQAIDEKFSLSENVILFSNTQELGIKYFLHMSWEKLKELETVYGGLDNLCFGNGLQLLVQKLGIHVHHEASLSDATRLVMEQPKGRSTKE